MSLRISTMVLTVAALGLGACASLPSALPSIKQSGETYTLNAPLANFTDYILIKTNDGQNPSIVSSQTALNDLARYDVVFVGESHGHTANHRLQANVFSGLYSRHKNMALSMEQFERDKQGVLDQYLKGAIGEAMLTENDTGWKHYKQSYRPMIEFAKAHNLPVIAANAPGMAVRCVGMNGPAFLDTIAGEKRGWVAQELHLQDGPYKDKFYGLMGGGSHGSTGANKQDKNSRLYKSFAGQVTRDDTMAESIYKHLQANPGAKVMHTNGSFHSAGLLGTAGRLALRDKKLKLANIHPVEVPDPNRPNFSAEDLAQGQYLLLITAPPEQYVKQENMMAFYKRTGKTMKTRKCEY